MELTLFVIIGTIAVVAAAMMLISENAVHSALFLILNFACIAFFFLMLHAPFLAMVQITVYAGAIMVLFLFVIMLLGAERLMPEQHPRFPWLSPLALVLSLAFLIVTSVVIIRGDIDLTDPQATAPHFRVVNALDDVAEIDLYLDDTRIVRSLEFKESTDFEQREPGRYRATVYPAGADPQADDPLVEQEVDLASNQAVSLVAIGSGNEIHLVTASEAEAGLEGDDVLRLTVINALPDRSLIDVADISHNTRMSLIENVPYAESSESVEIAEDVEAIGVFPDGDTRNRLASLENAELEADTSLLLIFADRRRPDNSYTNVVIDLRTNTSASFGSPTHVGQILFNRYVLPFEMVALVLLAAMIGALVLTHEEVTQRRIVKRRLANPSGALERPITGETGK